MKHQPDKADTEQQSIYDWMPLLFLIDVALMFLGLFVANAATWWIWLPYHMASLAYTIFVLRLARLASRHVTESIPHQHIIGVLLYVSCHAIRLFSPGEIPIGLVGYSLFAGPISLVFLFDHFCEDTTQKETKHDFH
jgi:hypothetical protein